MKRIQRKRNKGWRMPKNAIYVGRPTKWGNPFSLYGDGRVLRTTVLKRYETKLKELVKADSHFLDPLQGKDLVCWCKLDEPCHADILIKYLTT